MQDQICKHFYVSGRVQGVWFRAATKTEAEKLGLTGWARNLPDGRVEVLACGNKVAIDALHAWLLHGPILADVKELLYEEAPWQAFTGFEIR